ncbi:MAG TPA: fumarylacetoacetate hydrolase family protein [Acidimicrobiales bacterium]|nr:fumarylacetoacetate hydrolase family protein [Acidimicrobiales bacterium]
MSEPLERRPAGTATAETATAGSATAGVGGTATAGTADGGSGIAGRGIALAAAALVASRLGGGVLGRLPDGLRPESEAEAYRVQSAARPLLTAGGFGRQGGWKIGCTTATMQRYLGVDSPCAGTMFLAGLWRATHRFVIPAGRRLGVECEIAVRLGADLPPRPGGWSADAVAPAVAACIAAIEVVEDRYDSYPDLDTPTLIADDFFHHAAVLGAEHERSDARLLREATASMAINGEPVGSGAGSDVLGEPLAALAWLATAAAGWGTPLRAGEIVLLGSLVQTCWVHPGDRVLVRNEPLGTVEATFDGA